MHRNIACILFSALALSLLAAPVARAQQPEPTRPHRFTLSLRATAQQYDIKLDSYPFGRRRARVLPLQLAAAYRLSRQFSLQTGAAWHTTSSEAPRRYLNSQSQLVEAHQNGLLSVAVPLQLRYAFLTESAARRWNGYALGGFTALLTRTTLTERAVFTGQAIEWTNGQLALMLTLGAGTSYRLGPRWQAEAEVWLSRSPATGFAARNFGLAASVGYRL